jgi:hypothetical protein
MSVINTYQDINGMCKPLTENMPVTQLRDGINTTNALATVNNGIIPQLTQYENSVRYLEHTNQRYWQAEANRQSAWNNEASKYGSLMSSQNNLLNQINYLEIRLWRYQNHLYYRTRNGQLLIDNQIEIQKELSSRYGLDVYIVNDMNNVLRGNNNIRINTVFIAINSLPSVEEELFNPHAKYELFQDRNGVWKRNLLAYTRYSLKGLPHDKQYASFTKTLMCNIAENTSELISTWIRNIGMRNDTILLLIGNQIISKDIILDKVITRLFNTGIVTTLTDEMLQKKSLAEIVNGTLFLHIDHIPKDEHDREKLRVLLTSLIIQRSVLSNGYTIPTQTKVIVTIDEVDLFFKDFMEITTTLFIKSEKDLLSEYGISSKISLYLQIENTLDDYATEISSMSTKSHKELQNDNQRYMELISLSTHEAQLCGTAIPVLDPYSEKFDSLLPKGDYHTLITGLTRIGKSFLMLSLIIRYFLRGDCSIILFDIHSDLAKKVIKLIKDPKRLLYISPILSSSHSTTINLFETSDKSEKNIAKLSQIILRVLKSIKMDESFSGPMEELLINCIRVLLRKGGGSFAELYRFMNDKRNEDLVKYAKNSSNPLEEEYFNDYFKSATNTKDAVRRRLSSLLSDPLFSNLMNGINTVDLEKEMNTLGKIIIFDIPKGEMEITYEYYMKFILEYIQILALKRVERPKEQRTLTHLFLDEAHNFITPNGNVETILTEAGKYNLYLTMANPTISQYRTSDFRDILLSMTDAKIIGKNSNQTLDAMNKTLHTKLDDVENLSKGQFYVSVGNNNIVKIQNTDRFIDDQEHISDEQWQELKQYQLDHFYRPLKEYVTPQLKEEDFNKKIDSFINDIKSKDPQRFQAIKEIDPDMFGEIEHNFNDGEGYIAQPELKSYFNILNDNIYSKRNRDFIELLKRDALFEQEVKLNQKYKDKFRYALG